MKLIMLAVFFLPCCTKPELSLVAMLHSAFNLGVFSFIHGSYYLKVNTCCPVESKCKGNESNCIRF